MIQSLFVVVVNWNLKQDTQDCVDSLFMAGVKAGQIIVVDNASTDDSVMALRERFGLSVHVIQNEKNLGFGGGCNIGIKYALQQGASWVLLLNNDTYVAPTFVVKLENAICGNGDFAVLGSSIFYHDSPDRIWYLGDRLVPGLLATRSLYRNRRYNDDLSAIMPVDFISGCCMLIRYDVFERVGLFDETYFMYGEDVDFCWRARVAGFRLAIATRAKMWHKVSTSANQDAPLSRYMRVRNQNRFYRTFGRGLQIPVMIVFSALRAMGIIINDLIRGKYNLIAPLARGWIDGWINLNRSINSGNRSM